MAELAAHLAYLRGELEAAQRAPLSARKALLVVMLVDAYADRLFAAQAAEDDILAFREQLAAEVPALRLVFDVAAARARLVTEAVEVPIEAYDRLSVQDFMVSLYNGHTVQRVRIVAGDGTRYEAHMVLTEAVEALVAT